jgi:hypothetical protein
VPVYIPRYTGYYGGSLSKLEWWRCTYDERCKIKI